MKEIVSNCMLGLLIAMIIPALIGVWGSIEKKKQPAQVIDLTPLAGKREFGEAIMKYASRAEQRSLGRQIGPDIVLILPANFSREKLEYDAALNYDYLIENGPSQGVCTKVAK